jgi:transposase InsO family protein
MLNQTELETYFKRHNLSATARQVIHTVRNSPPTRRVKSGAANVSCRYASRKMGMIIQAESHKNELPALVTWDTDNVTHEIYDQPPKVKLRYRAINGRYVNHMATPDFFLLQDEFTGWVECKTEEWLQSRAVEGSELYVQDVKGNWRCPPGEQYAAELGLEFRVRSSAETNWNRCRNIEFLSDYMDERCPPAKQDGIDIIRKAMEAQAWIKIKALIDSGCDTDVIYKMVADELLYADLDQDLLAEPERTMLFRDRPSAEAYRIHLDSKRLPAISALRKVQLVAGQSLIWDGNPWRILNVGSEDVFMEDSNKVISCLPKTVMEQMVKDGIITGLPENESTLSSDAEEIIRHAGPKDFEHALYRFRCLFPEKSHGDVPQASKRAKCNWRGLYRKSEQIFGNGFLGLLPKINMRGNRERKIDELVIQIMNQVIDDYYAKPGAKSLVVCWGEACVQCKEKGLPPPSERTFRNEIKRRSVNAMVVARDGEKAAYAKSEFFWCLERTTPRHGDRPFEIGHIDHTQLDLQFVGARRGENLDKAWLTVLIDAHTRMILAWVIMFDPPSYRSCMAVIKECVKRHSRIPKYIVVDKGSDFESIYFECLLARIESHKKTRPGSKPRFGSIIERFFGMSNVAFVHNLLGNNKALQKPRSMSKTHDPRKLAVWTLPEFRDAFEGFLNNVYSQMEHSALGMSPKEAIAIGMQQSGLRGHMLIPYTNDFIIMCLPSTDKGTAKVDSGRGVKIGYIYYWTPEFRDPKYAKASVPVRYDPFDASTAFVWLGNHWTLCRSEYAAEFQGRSEKEIADATRELRTRLKREGSRRALNAQMVATYLRETANTEESLLQRSRQEDMLEAYDMRAIPVPPLPSLDNGLIQAEQNGWDNLNIKFFGDFK